MAFLTSEGTEHLVEKLSDSKNIKISGNQYGNRVSDVVDKLVKKADDITKAVEQEVINDSNMFKVGTGDVDVSSDVEDAFGEIGLRGKTYQNITPSGLFDSKEVWYSFECNLNNMYSSIENGYLTLQASGGFVNAFVPLKATLMKPNTKYTIILDILDCSLGIDDMTDSSYKFAIATTHPSEAFTTGYSMGENNSPIQKGIYKIVLTTKSNFDNVDWGTRFFISSEVTSGSITFRFYVLEGNHENTENLPDFIEGIVGVGDKSKNLLNPKSVKFGITLNTNTGEEMNSHLYVTSDFIQVMENTQYTTKGLPVVHYYNEAKEQISIKNSNKEGVITTPPGCKWVRLRNYVQILLNEQKFLINQSMFVLGTTNIFQPYYTNYGVEVVGCGKNLVDLKSMAIGTLNNSGQVILHSDGAYKLTQDFIKIDSKNKIYLYYEYEENDTSTPTHNMIAYYDKNFSYIGARFDENPKGALFTPHPDTCYIRLRVRKEAIKLSLTLESNPNYEPYQEDKIQILFDEPLMRLPNGVCDEITMDGKLIRRVGKIILDGTESWYKKSDMSNDTFTVMYSTRVKNSSVIKCDKLANCLVLDKYPDNNYDYECMHFEHLLGSEIATAVFLRLEATSDDEFVEKVRRNPIIIYYQLQTPVVSELPTPYLRFFKDGYLKFNTMVAPESTHKVQLNKSAQIESCIEQVSLIGRRVENMEALYDDLLLQTSRDVDLLSFDYNLETGDE